MDNFINKLNVQKVGDWIAKVESRRTGVEMTAIVTPIKEAELFGKNSSEMKKVKSNEFQHKQGGVASENY